MSNTLSRFTFSLCPFLDLTAENLFTVKSKQHMPQLHKCHGNFLKKQSWGCLCLFFQSECFRCKGSKSWIQRKAKGICTRWRKENKAEGSRWKKYSSVTDKVSEKAVHTRATAGHMTPDSQDLIKIPVSWKKGQNIVSCKNLYSIKRRKKN